MAITTLDGALAGMQAPQFIAKAVTPTLVAGRPHSLAYLNGSPGAFAAPATTATGVALSSSSSQVAGQIPHTDPGSGNAYLARFLANATQPGMLLLCDRLLQVAGISTPTSAISVTSTSAQTLNTTTLPARDRSGATSGDGVQCAMEVVSVMGSGAGNAPTIGYTNQAGTASRSGGLVDAYVASSVAGAFYRFALQSGDTGVESVQTFQNTATMTSGTICLVLYRVLAALAIPAANVPDRGDALTLGFPRLYNGVVPFLVFIPNTTTASLFSGTVVETQG